MSMQCVSQSALQLCSQRVIERSGVCSHTNRCVSCADTRQGERVLAITLQKGSDGVGCALWHELIQDAPGMSQCTVTQCQTQHCRRTQLVKRASLIAGSIHVARMLC